MSGGLSLRTGINAGASYTPSGSGSGAMTPPSAQPSTAGRLSIAQQAYGISGTGMSNISALPAVGSVSVGIAALIGLVYLWWSLPR